MFNKTKVPIMLVLLLSLCLHIYFFISHPAGFFDIFSSRDAGKYYEMAMQLINDGIYGYNATHSNAYVTPGHPLYLTALIKVSMLLGVNEFTVVRLSNMVLSITTVFLIYLISINVFKKEVVAVISALLLATYMSPLHSFRTFLTETPAIFMFILSVYVFTKALNSKSMLHHALFGIVACITLMFRPTPAPLLILGIFIIMYNEGFRRAVYVGCIWLIGPLVVILPWVIRNYMTFGEFYLFSSHSGNPLLGGTNPFYLQPFDEILKENTSGLTQEEFAIQRIKEGLATNPSLWISWFTVGKLIELFKEPWAFQNYYKFFTNTVKSFFLFQHFFVLVSGVLSGILFVKHKRLLMFSIVAITYIVLSNMFITEPRYGFYIIPIFCIISGYGLVHMYKFCSNLFQSLKAYSTK
jgi:4-amino-4-deoxy-L-arabinose transferase-like glycosyltransferase